MKFVNGSSSTPSTVITPQVAAARAASETLEQKIARLEAENAALKTAKQRKITSLKASEKGCVSINGLRRFPIALYPSEIAAIDAKMPEIKQFIEQNRAALSFKFED